MAQPIIYLEIVADDAELLRSSSELLIDLADSIPLAPLLSKEKR